MKYRIKNIRRESWVETEEKLFRPAEDVAPIILPEDEPIQEITDEIYIIPDEEPEAKAEETVLFTPPLPPVNEQPKEEKKPLIPFLKTKESKIMAGLIGGFALLLVIFIIVVLCLGPENNTSDDEQPNGSNNTTTHIHDYKTIIIKEVTCTEEGAVIEECSICKYSAEGEQTVDALGHKWKTDKNKTVEATCEEDGEIHRECERCKLTESEVQPAKGHTWIETGTTEATCTEEGETKLRCTNCDKKETKTEPKKEHELSDPVRTEPTCDKEGKEVATCTVCGKEEVTLIEKLPHETEPATCESGEKCKVCGEEVSEPLGHKFEDDQCTVCGTVLGYTGTASNITVGEKMQIGTGISLYAESYDLSSGKLTINITITVTDKFTTEKYYFTPDKISVTAPDGSNAALVADGALFNLPAQGSVSGSIIVDEIGSGEYVLNILGENNIYHTCRVTIE